jgi:anti-sigma B factor antagonist
MKILQQDGILNATNIEQLGAINAELFREEMQAAMSPDLKAIEVDFSDTSFVDSHGLGALLSVHKTACHRHGDVPLRLLNPQPSVRQILELTRMHRIFEIVKRPVAVQEVAG